MLSITAIPVFNDNYIWLLQQGRHVIVVDPGDASPVLDYLATHKLTLNAILITHHHQDHVGGVSRLLEHHPTNVFAPSYRPYAFPHQPVSEGDTLSFPDLGLQFVVLWLPGHTLDHVAYVHTHHLFCGDVLFSAGCGRLFEGTPAQMFMSLMRLKQLPKNTKVYCTHEYTAKNIAFAKTVEPNNHSLLAYEKQVNALRANNQPTLPSNLGLESAINPFLRCDQAHIQAQFSPNQQDALSTFTALRELRNHY